MKKILFLPFILILITSCYTYKPYEPESTKTNENVPRKLQSVRGENNNTEQNNRDENSLSIENIIKSGEFYQINAFGNTYKMEADKWVGDTIYGNVKGKPNKQLKFNKNDIKDVKIRTFSKGRSDALTVAAYVLGGVAIVLLLK